MRNSKTKAIVIPWGTHTKIPLISLPKPEHLPSCLQIPPVLPSPPRSGASCPEGFLLTNSRILLSSAESKAVSSQHWENIRLPVALCCRELMAIHELPVLQHDPICFLGGFFSQNDLRKRGKEKKRRKAFSRDISTIPLMATETGPKSSSK